MQYQAKQLGKLAEPDSRKGKGQQLEAEVDSALGGDPSAKGGQIKHLLIIICMFAEPDRRQDKEDKPEPEANFALSGKLAAESNTVKGVVLVHQEPPEARKPSQMWRLYGFKNGMAGDKKKVFRQCCNHALRQFCGLCNCCLYACC